MLAAAVLLREQPLGQYPKDRQRNRQGAKARYQHNMDYTLITLRLGQQVRQHRLNRGLTQAQLAALACVTRQKVIAVEKGDLSVGMLAYARVLGALDCEFAVVPAVMPTLEEIQGMFD